MTTDEIRLALFKIRKEGGAMAHIGRDMDPPVSRQAVSAVIHRAIVSRRIAMEVARVLGMEARFVFPEYFSKKLKKQG